MADRRSKHTDSGGAVSGSIMQSGGATSGEKIERVVDGASVMLYDPRWVGNFLDLPSAAGESSRARLLASWFEPDDWRDRGALRGVAQGRGNTWFVESPIPGGEGTQAASSKIWVLRHYRRGGLMAKLWGDRYLFSRDEQTRPWREFELLQTMRTLALPVPTVVAARVERTGRWYRGDLLTEAIEDSHTLASELAQGVVPETRWRELGQLVARFHAVGIHHADLNAHNVLINPEGLWLIDFDRGLQRTPGLWCDAVLARLRRSLLKVCDSLNPSDQGSQATLGSPRPFNDEQWSDVLHGYRDGLR